MLAAACHTHHWDRRDQAAERIAVLADASIDPHGVNDEQSVEYQDFNYFRYRAATQLLSACGRTEEPWQQRLPRMVEVLTRMIQPDGTYAPIGDTDRRAPRFADHDPHVRWLTSGGTHGTPPAPEDTFASYDAGYTFSRSGWGTQPCPVAADAAAHHLSPPHRQATFQARDGWRSTPQ